MGERETTADGEYPAPQVIEVCVYNREGVKVTWYTPNTKPAAISFVVRYRNTASGTVPSDDWVLEPTTERESLIIGKVGTTANLDKVIYDFQVQAITKDGAGAFSETVMYTKHGEYDEQNKVLAREHKIETADEAKAVGNKFFEVREFKKAVGCYTIAIKLCKQTDDGQLHVMSNAGIKLFSLLCL